MGNSKESGCEFEKVTLQAVCRAGPLINETLLVDILQVVGRKYLHLGAFKVVEAAETKLEGH